MAIHVFVNADNIVEYFWRITFQWENITTRSGCYKSIDTPLLR